MSVFPETFPQQMKLTWSSDGNWGTLFIIQVLLEQPVSKVTRKQRQLQMWVEMELPSYPDLQESRRVEMEHEVSFTCPSLGIAIQN